MSNVNFITESDIHTLSKNDILLFTSLYDRVKSALQDSRKVDKIMSWVAKYRDKNIDVLSSPYIINSTYFTPSDYNIIYDTIGIEEKEIKKLIKRVQLPGKLTKPKANFTPFNVLMCLILRYYKYDDKSTKAQNYYHLMYAYYAYSMYWSLFKKYYRFPPREATMKYVINNLNGKFLIKQTKNLEEALLITISTALDTYTMNLKRCGDSDLMSIIDAIKTRMSNFMKNIWKEYKEANEKGEVQFSMDDFDDEGNLRSENLGVVNKVEVMTNYAVTKFFQNETDMKVISMSAKMCQASVNEIRTAVNLLKEESRISEVKEFYSALFYLYFMEHPDKEKPAGLRFLYEMDAIYKKGNSNDKNIKIIKSLMNDWLERGSASYRTSTNVGTLNNFRKAIFWFFVQNV